MMYTCKRPKEETVAIEFYAIVFFLKYLLKINKMLDK